MVLNGKVLRWTVGNGCSPFSMGFKNVYHDASQEKEV